MSLSFPDPTLDRPSEQAQPGTHVNIHVESGENVYVNVDVSRGETLTQPSEQISYDEAVQRAQNIAQRIQSDWLSQFLLDKPIDFDQYKNETVRIATSAYTFLAEKFDITYPPQDDTVETVDIEVVE